jgi:hypothetical protein
MSFMKWDFAGQLREGINLEIKFQVQCNKLMKKTVKYKSYNCPMWLEYLKSKYHSKY